MDKAKLRISERSRRAARVRKKVIGTPDRPRLCVRRSLKHIYAQLVDDINGQTIVQVGSRGKSFSEKVVGKDLTKKDVSKLVGELLADMAIQKGVKSIVFDRKGYLFHGRVKTLAEAAREKGLVF
jgi:large subunit ribosomal protein L18